MGLQILLSPEVLSVTELWQLEKSKIGEEVIILKDHPKETKENRRMAAKIVERWYRMLTNTSENMKELSHIEEERANQPAPERKKRRTTSEADLMERSRGQAGSWMQVRIPYPESMTFVRR